MSASHCLLWDPSSSTHIQADKKVSYSHNRQPPWPPLSPSLGVCVSPVLFSDLSRATWPQPNGGHDHDEGINGAGKSTTLQILTRDLQATSGHITVQGKSISSR